MFACAHVHVCVCVRASVSVVGAVGCIALFEIFKSCLLKATLTFPSCYFVSAFLLYLYIYILLQNRQV